MATLGELKTRIVSVANIKKITRAMELVSAAKYHRANMRVNAARPYAAEMDDTLKIIAGLAETGSAESGDSETPISLAFQEGQPPIETYREKFFADKEAKKPGVVVITSDRGLCGAFNTKLINAGQKFINEHPDKDCKLICLGRRGYNFFSAKKTPIIHHQVGISDKLLIEEINQLSAKLVELFATDEVDAVYLIYTKFRTIMSSDITVEKFLSIPPVEGTTSEETYLLEPDRDTLIEKLLAIYATTKIFSVLADSFASEYGARMSAMQMATKNADEMLGDLVIARNRMRQATITKELAEIIGGVEALK
jgi:F-type H+-transporting ATPase subunit gamma